MTSLINEYVERVDFDSYEDFAQNFKFKMIYYFYISLNNIINYFIKY